MYHPPTQIKRMAHSDEHRGNEWVYTNLRECVQFDNLCERDRSGTQPAEFCRSMPNLCISCPTCDHDLDDNRLSVHRDMSFSNLTCERCNVTCSSKFWLCQCGIAWTNCARHRPAAMRQKTEHISIRQSLKRKFGEVKPYPTKRTAPHDYCKASSAKRLKQSLEPTGPPEKRIRLAIGSKLALKFPHLVQLDSTTKGAVQGGGTPDCNTCANPLVLGGGSSADIATVGI